MREIGHTPIAHVCATNSTEDYNMMTGKYAFDDIKDGEKRNEIQSLIAKEQHHLVSDLGWKNSGPAYYQACENVGREYFFPAIGGPKLAGEIGKYTAQNARDAKTIAEPNQLILVSPSNHNGSINIVMGDIEDIPPDKTRGSFSGDPNVERLKAAILAMPIGKALPAMFDDQKMARKTANRLYAWANHIHSKDNGWMLRAPSIGNDGTVKFLKVPYHNK